MLTHFNRFGFHFYCWLQNGTTIYRMNISGKWRVVSDTSYNVFTLTLSSENYIGKSGDYDDFRTNGKVYINESNVLDTSTYAMVNDTTIQIQNFGWILNGVQDYYLKYNAANSSMSITTNKVFTPEGYGWRAAVLQR